MKRQQKAPCTDRQVRRAEIFHAGEELVANASLEALLEGYAELEAKILLSRWFNLRGSQLLPLRR